MSIRSAPGRSQPGYPHSARNIRRQREHELTRALEAARHYQALLEMLGDRLADARLNRAQRNSLAGDLSELAAVPARRRRPVQKRLRLPGLTKGRDRRPRTCSLAGRRLVALGDQPSLSFPRMTRRSTPERLHAARRIAVRNGLTDHGMPLELAERWCDAWEREADAHGLDRQSPTYWDGAGGWIEGRRQDRRTPD